MMIYRLLGRWLCLMILITAAWFSSRLLEIYTKQLYPTATEIVIPAGTNAYQVATMVHQLELSPDPVYVWLWLKYSGLDRQIKAGVHRIDVGQPLVKLMDRMTSDRREFKSITLVEGTRLTDMLELINQEPWLQGEAVINWDQVITSEYRNKISYEGLFLADTYFIEYHQSPEILLKTSHQALLDTLNQLWLSRDPMLPYKHPYEALIVASILEKETAYQPERPLIAGVVLRRLKLRMHLGICSTVLYLMPGKTYVNISDTKIDSPYNTYRYLGLPPTPIATVSHQALWAAFHPEASDYLYYVSMRNGRHFFSENYSDHKLAVSKFK